MIDGVILFQRLLGFRERLDGQADRGLLDEHVQRVGLHEQGGEGLFGIGELGLGQLDLSVCELYVELGGLHQFGQCSLGVEEVRLGGLDSAVLGFDQQLIRLAGERGKRLNAVGQLGLSRRDGLLLGLDIERVGLGHQVGQVLDGCCQFHFGISYDPSL